jgi:hypothetical protein
MDADERGELEINRFDDELWLLLIQSVDSVDDCARYGEPVVLYYASRYLEGDVGNGGFAQAAYNCPELFEPAARAYDQLGLPQAAGLIRAAMSLLAKENRTTTFVAEEIGELFSQFADGELAKLDKRLDESGFWAIDARIRYVRQHRDAFRPIS